MFKKLKAKLGRPKKTVEKPVEKPEEAPTVNVDLERKVSELERFISIADEFAIHRLGQAYRMLENAKRELTNK